MRWNYLAGILTSVIFLIIFVLTLLPVPIQTINIPFSTEDNDKGILILTTPAWLKVGDRSRISLKLEFSQDKPTPKEQNTLNLVSQLELGNLELMPKGEGHVKINPQDSVTFRWLVKATYKGEFSGTLWLFKLRSDENRMLILARSIELESREFLGFSYRTSRKVAIVGVAFGLILSISFILHFNKAKKLSAK